MDDSCTPVILDIKDSSHFSEFEKIKRENDLFIYDQIRLQLCELIKNQNPQVKFSHKQLLEESFKKVSEKETLEYGLWVYYPWSKKMVHIIDKEEFVFLRTIRNRFKITQEESDILSKKKVGVIGLSVGQSVALTMAMERSFGELRIADFDTLEVSNLNRIRTGIHNLGLPKTIAVVREIAEIDPFLNVKCFHEGINDDNIDAFIGSGEELLDMLIDECDSLDVKIKSRLKARDKKIPVLMDTSDRGMLDVERFDLEPDREVLHGFIEDELEQFIEAPRQEDFFRLAMKILDGDTISERMKFSMTQIGKNITSWPQLASSVMFGGGVTAEAYRQIMLGKNVPSGRYYFDPEKKLINKL